MNTLEQLFAFGYPEETFDIKGVKFTLTVLDSKRLTDALNASNEEHPSAQLLSYKTQVLARAITAINGVTHFDDIHSPNQEQVQHFLLNVLQKFHYSVINTLFTYYEKLDGAINKDIEEEVKKSQSNRGV